MARVVTAAVYAVVLVAGVYYAVVHGGGVADVVAFGGVMLVLFAVLAVERPERARVLLGLKLVLFALAAATDGSGLSKALFVLLPFTAYLALGRRAGLTTAALCLAGLVAVLQLTAPGWTGDAEQVGDLLMFTIGLVLALAAAETASAEARARVRLEESHARVAELSAAAERGRVARDLHDSLGHHLTAVSVQLEKAEVFRDRDPDAAARAVAEARAAARNALEDVREAVKALRPGFRIRPALRELVESATGPEVVLEVRGDESGTDEAALTTLYRAAQEALTNARRHARATEVRVAVTFDGDLARLEVADNGHGLTSAREGHGLTGMRERAALAGGDVHLVSSPAGTTVTVTVPRRTG